MKVFETKVTMDNVKINLIKPMTNSPFTVKEDEDMQKLRESINQFGLLSPIVIRQLPTQMNMRSSAATAVCKFLMSSVTKPHPLSSTTYLMMKHWLR